MQLTWLIVSTHLKLTLEVEQTLSKSPTIKNLLFDSMSFQQVTVLTHRQHSAFFKDEDLCVTLHLPGMLREFIETLDCAKEHKRSDTTAYAVCRVYHFCIPLRHWFSPMVACVRLHGRLPSGGLLTREEE